MQNLFGGLKEALIINEYQQSVYIMVKRKCYEGRRRLYLPRLSWWSMNIYL